MPIIQQVKTPGGAMRHRPACRFVRKAGGVLCANNPLDRKLSACGVCRPEDEQEPGGRLLSACAYCLDGTGHYLTVADAKAAGYLTTATGHCYHMSDACPLVGGIR